MKTYLAVLKHDINIKDLEAELKKKNIKPAAHYKTIGVVKLESEKPVSPKDFKDYFLSIEEDKDNLTI
ncbi:hypothetical protein ATE47_14445 [Chryseobacterium sp. IHB B 17019]|jgi:hypothetical protein|uniref:hypothetical protein n=1 Tax=Chryseobacterium sp. IHB B 17019 TaxID=1721091 RepID=UPI00071EE8E2|nr:hypothetical protein [Chryseobacterium sp. IHB B 17019]ALR31632.1 hypothetical protein ATE47_14445 [Chryseobacterium sp. IHB B 17019]